MANPIPVKIQRVKNVKPEFQKIINEHVKATGKPLKGFVFKNLGRTASLGMCKCQCSSTLDCGGGGGGGGSYSKL